MWSFLILLAPVLRFFSKCFAGVLVFGIVLTLIQVVFALSVVAWEGYFGSTVSQAEYGGLCVVLFVGISLLYVWRRHRVRGRARHPRRDNPAP